MPMLAWSPVSPVSAPVTLYILCKSTLLNQAWKYLLSEEKNPSDVSFESCLHSARNQSRLPSTRGKPLSFRRSGQDRRVAAGSNDKPISIPPPPSMRVSQLLCVPKALPSPSRGISQSNALTRPMAMGGWQQHVNGCKTLMLLPKRWSWNPRPPCCCHHEVPFPFFHPSVCFYDFPKKLGHMHLTLYLIFWFF